MLSILARVYIAVKRHHDHSNSYKGKHFIGVGLQYLVHYCHGGKHSSIQPDTVLVTGSSVLHFDLKASE